MAVAMAARSFPTLSSSPRPFHSSLLPVFLSSHPGSPSQNRIASLQAEHCYGGPFLSICSQLRKKERSHYAKYDSSISIVNSDWRGAEELLQVKNLLTVLLTLAISQILSCGHALAVEAIKASSLGLQFAAFLRGTGWTDEAIVFVMAMLPVLELRGAIPVGYWMRLDPVRLSVLSVLGNMVPVPLILLYMEKLSKFLADTSPTTKQYFDSFLESTRRKSGPIQEFKWLGLMLFVAVPFPGTGAWTGAMAASVLRMPFWDAMSANFLGVVMAGLLMNLLVNLGVKYAVLVGIALFLVSTFIWSFLRLMVKAHNKSIS